MVDISQIPQRKDTARLPTAFEQPIRGLGGMGPVLVDLPTLAEKDIAVQTGAQKQDTRSSFEDLISSTTAEEITSKGVTMLGNTPISPIILQKAREDKAFKAKLYESFVKSNAVPTIEEDRLAVPFSSPDLTKIRRPAEIQSQPQWVQDIFDRAVTRSQNIAKIFQQDSPVPLAGQRIILDEFKTGSLGEEVARSLKSIPGDFARLPTLAVAAGGAAAGLYNAKMNDNPDTGFKEDFTETFQSVMTAYGSFDTVQAYEEALQNSVILRNSEKRVQEWYKDSFIKRFGQDAWTVAHQRPSYKIEEDKQGNKSVEPILDADGKHVMEDVGLPPEIASSLVEMAYNELTGTQKAVSIFATQAPFTLGLTMRSISKGQKYIDKVTEARKQKPGTYGSDMSDYDVFVALSKKEGNIITRTFRKGWAAATLGKIARAGKKESMTRAARVNDHLKVLDEYTTNINRLKNDIEVAGPWSKLNTARKLEDAKKELQTLENGLKSYTRGKGRGYFDNPYTRGLIADDIVISTAIGYAPTILDWSGIGLDEGTAEVLTGIVTPLVTPVMLPVGRGLLSVGVSVTNKFTDGTIKDIALTFENANYLPFITEGMLVRGDEGAMRRAMADAGEEVTDEQIQSFTTMAGIFKSMKPEARIRSYNALRRYNELMSRTQKRMEELYLTDAKGMPITDETAIQEAYTEIAANMRTLHLSLAKATGLAPLISVQYIKGNQLKPSDLTNPGTMDDILSALAREEDNYRGMDTLLKTMQGRFAKKGIELDSNEPLQAMMAQIEQVVVDGRVGVNVKKQEMQKLLNQFYNSTETIDEDTVKRIVDLEIALEDSAIRDTVDRSKKAAEVALKLTEAARVQGRTLLAAAETMDEKGVLKSIRPIADKLFDIEHGRRRALGSIGYRKANRYVPEGSDQPVSVDMTNVVRELTNLSDDLRGKPLSFMFSGGRQFFGRAGGDALEKTFENMARKGLQETFQATAEATGTTGEQAAQLLLNAALENGDITRASYAELAIFMIDNAAEEGGDIFKYFKATPEEAEDVYRYFRDRAAALDPDKSGEIARSFTSVIDKAFEDTDPQLARLVREARDNYQKVMGYQMDTGRYMSDVLNSRQRRDVTEQAPEEGAHFYRNVQGRPEAPFIRIAKAFQKLADTTDEVKISELKDEIAEQKNRIMFFLGAERNSAGEYVFDLRNSRQRRAADAAQSLMEALIGKRMIAQARNETKAMSEVRSLLSGESPETARDAVMAVQEGSARYDFSRAKRITDAEKILTVPVIEADGSDGVRVLGMSDQVRGFVATTDDLLRQSDRAKITFRDVKADVEDTGSIIRIAAQQEVDASNAALKKMERIEALTQRPQDFFDRVFEGQTVDSLDAVVARFKAGGMSEEEIEQGLKYMYIRGLYGKAGMTYNKMVGQADAVQEVADINVLIDHVNDPTKRAIMSRVLGEDHTEELEDMAEWAKFASGDGYGFRASPDTRGMSIDSMFARVFNLARGMVSPLYLATEVSARIMLARNQTLVNLALTDREAARIINNILVRPESAEIPVSELEALAARIQNYIATDLITSGGEIPNLDIMLGERPDISTPEDVIEAEKQEEQEEMVQIIKGENDDEQEEQNP
jgi:hypothetical protein